MYVSPISSRFWFGRLTPAIRAIAQPCLCLWRGLLQMTMVVPCRLITRQRSHMGLTDGRTFISLPVPVGDSTAVQVVRAQLHLDLVPGEDADVVLAHLPGDGRENGVAGVELHPE